jgi:hypothetical protein
MLKREDLNIAEVLTFLKQAKVVLLILLMEKKLIFAP